MTKNKKAFCCWSGGKESALSLYNAQKSGIDVSYLVNMVSVDGRHSCSHGVSSDLLKLQAEAIGIPIVQRRTTWNTYEEEFKKVISDLKKEGINRGVFGDIDLEEHREWVERVCKEAGIKPVLPLWKEKRKELLKEFIQAGFKAVVVTLNTDFLDKEWLGQQINAEFVEELKTRGNVDLCGENGEYHTFVTDGPIFKRPIEITGTEKIKKGNYWFLNILELK